MELIMVREGPAEPPPPNVADTPEGRRARPYGMQLTTAIAVIAIVIFAYFLLREGQTPAGGNAGTT
jgi:hypothetical protein